MRKVIVSTFMSLDGVMQAPGGPEEDPTGGFTLGGWLTPYWDESMNAAMGQFMSQPFDLLLGRKTYEIFAAHWPFAGDNPITDKFNKAVKHVATTTLDQFDWVNTKRIEGDVAAGVKQLKTGDGPDLQVHGSSGLLQTLIGAGLVDDYRIWIFPVVLGRGKRLFREGAPDQALQLTGSVTSGTGVIMNSYRPAGALKPGSFALAQPSAAELARREKMKRESEAGKRERGECHDGRATPCGMDDSGSSCRPADLRGGVPDGGKLQVHGHARHGEFHRGGGVSHAAGAGLARRPVRGRVDRLLPFGRVLFEAALLAGAYVIFLGFSFHGPSHWAKSQDEFGFFVDHFTFLAGLLFAAVHGPGPALSLKAGFPKRPGVPR